MGKKNQEYYTFVLDVIKKLAKKFGYEIHPDFIISDFELGEINALKNAFPWASIIGCWFHYTQAIQKWFNSNRIEHKQDNNLEANIIKSSILCLAWLPCDLVLFYWKNSLIPKIENTFKSVTSSKLIIYMNSTWFKRYQISDWNIFNKPIWTNNPIENTNKQLKEIFNSHSTKQEFLKTVFKVNDTFICDWIKYTDVKKTYPKGNNLKKKKKEALIKLSYEFWSTDKLKAYNKLNNKNKIEYSDKFMKQLTNIRIMYNQNYIYKHGTNKDQIIIDKFLSEKPLTNRKQEIITCNICNNNFYLSIYKKHKLHCVAHCKKCNTKFSSQIKLQEHLKEHETKKNIFFCENKSCRRKYTNLQNYNKHKLECIEFKCPHCIKNGNTKIFISNRKVLIKNHLLGQHKIGQKLKCKYCEKTFYKNYEKTQHQKSAHQEHYKQHVCNICHRQFWNKSKHKTHQKNCLGNIPIDI